MIPTILQSSPSLFISSADSCPAAVFFPTYPKVKSLPRILCLILVTHPVSPIPRMRCLRETCLDAM